ncbi:CDP-alcohol phosphatidyltransferase [Caldalkalibacillus thermarum]|uniref:sugar phosphate nucleotidyltransferase n=1 Tax=Caldalkalibacillus thermarum TaxID=296745 RepID=UPI001665010E|nr:sugar phosphate nucleotidyltransferase [Caldalkalibacillus thermarum]GGK30225.1 CDP-alcohol phosphatidyltransferase [Caldalkalibacillus thermarum]
MRAAILAAGEGRRLRPHFSGPKPLIHLLGLSLIERNMLTLRESGIQEIVIVTGCHSAEIQEALGDGSKWGIKITYVHNPDWQKGNGVSAYALHTVFRPEEKFVLMMADHIFEPQAVRAFVAEAEKISDSEVLLAADRNLDRVHDVEECTKIQAEHDRAQKLGKDLGDFNAVDCGLFMCTGALFPALSQAIAQGRHALTDGINILAKQGKVKLHFVDQAWVDVDDRESFHHAEHMLLKSLVPDKDGLISRHLNRKVSLQITKRLASTPVTPNQVTVASFIVSLASALSFAAGFPLVGGLLAQFSSILDGVDGELARLKFLQSQYGGLVDAILDRYADFFIVAGMAYWWCLQTDQPIMALLVSAAALSGIPMSMLVKEKYKALTGRTYIPETDDGLWRYLPANRDGRLFIVMLGGIFNLIPATLILLAVTTHLAAIVRLVQLRKLM